MSSLEPAPDSARRSRSRSPSPLRSMWQQGLAMGKTELLKGKLHVQHSLGLGPRPNAIPAGDANIHGDLRLVEIGWHPVAGMGGKWFAEQTRLGKFITEKTHKYPDPTQHWAVLVGGYCHELWMDEHLDVIYINEKVKREEWHTFKVGQTRFNDEALRQAGEMVIHNMRQQRPAYNLIDNNCQTFAVALLDAIQIGAHKDFATSFAVYQRMTGKGRIKDLFVDKHPEEQAGPGNPGIQRQQTVKAAQVVMEQNTTHLDHHDIPIGEGQSNNAIQSPKAGMLGKLFR